MEKTLIGVEEGKDIHCNAWNLSAQRMAGGTRQGFVHIFDADKSASSSRLSCTSKFQVHHSSVLKIVWAPPEYGDVIASCSVDGNISLWEEVDNGNHSCIWKCCYQFQDAKIPALDIQFGDCDSGLRLIIAFSDGHVKVYESLRTLDLNQWQLQAEFQNVNDAVERFVKCSCLSASLAWKPYGCSFHRPTFILGLNSNVPQFNVPKIWQFVEAHQRWFCITKLCESGEEEYSVTAISWAPNIGRPYELIAIATAKGISIWHVEVLLDGSVQSNRVGLLSGHNANAEIWQLDWDMGGLTLASAAGDGIRLWQSNARGLWREVSQIQSN